MKIEPQEKWKKNIQLDMEMKINRGLDLNQLQLSIFAVNQFIKSLILTNKKKSLKKTALLREIKY